jgi:DNA-binding response OmpR family regulator
LHFCAVSSCVVEIPEELINIVTGVFILLLLHQVRLQYRFAHAARVKRILFVEDHNLFREGMAFLIEWRTGYGCIQADSLTEARRILGDTKDKPICVIVDLDLPEGDSIKLVEQLRELPVLALTNIRSLEGRIRALEAGADEVLSSSAPAEEILRTVKWLIDLGH